MDEKVHGAGDPIHEHVVFDNKIVKLMSMNRNIPCIRALPKIFPVYRDANQMGHDLAQAMVVISLHPDHLYMPLRIGQFSNKGEKLPVLFFQPSEIEIAEDVSQKYQAAELDGSQ